MFQTTCLIECCMHVCQGPFGWQSVLKHSLLSFFELLFLFSRKRHFHQYFVNTSPWSHFPGWFTCFFWYFRESLLMSSDHSSSFSTTSRTLPLPCRCTILLPAPLDKVGREQWQLWLQPPGSLLTHTGGVSFLLARCTKSGRNDQNCFYSLLPDEFARAVYVATGLKLTRHLVHTIFKIFDVDHDDQLSYKEFIGIMKDRLHRGGRVRNKRALFVEKKCSQALNCLT